MIFIYMRKLDMAAEIKLKARPQWTYFWKLNVCPYRVKQPLVRVGIAWLGWYGWTLWGIVDGWKSSSMSRTLASWDLDFNSFLSNSFIFFWTWIVFLVIFSPGRDIRKNQGIHWRKISWTWKSFIKWFTQFLFYPIRHLMSVNQAMVIVEHHDCGDHAGGHHEHDAVEICSWHGDSIRFFKVVCLQ